MALRDVGCVELPAHAKARGFDHAAVHHRTGRVFVAHSANGSVDINIATYRYVEPIGSLTRARIQRPRSRVHIEPRREHRRHRFGGVRCGPNRAATGLQATAKDDHDNMAKQFPAYDALYAYCRSKLATTK